MSLVNRRLIQLKNLVIMANGFKREQKKWDIIFRKGKNNQARTRPDFVDLGDSCTIVSKIINSFNVIKSFYKKAPPFLMRLSLYADW